MLLEAGFEFFLVHFFKFGEEAREVPSLDVTHFISSVENVICGIEIHCSDRIVHLGSNLGSVDVIDFAEVLILSWRWCHCKEV